METPKQFKYNSKVSYNVPVCAAVGNVSKEIKPESLSNLNIYVTEKDYFLVKFQNIFTDYIIDFTNKKDVFNWSHSRESYMKFWQCQLNFVIWCSTTGCGISRYHLFDESLPNLVKSVIRFHVYFNARKLLSMMGVALPGDDAFNPKNNPINMSKFNEICREYNVKSSDDFRFLVGPSNGMGIMYANMGSRKNVQVRVQYGEDGLYFRDHDYTSKYFGAGVNVNHLTNPLAKNGWNHFILNDSQGLTKPGIQSLNSAIRNYVILTLGCQVETRSSLISSESSRFDAELQFLKLFNSIIDQSKGNMTSDEISRFQDYVTKAKVHLNYVIAPQLYLISNNLIMNLNSNGYNNELIIAGKNQTFGINPVNQKQIPRVPLMQGHKPRVRPLSSVSHHKSLTLLDPKPVTYEVTHSNVKMALFFLSSFVLGVAFYFK